MQNPDSPTARALNDLVKAHESGDLDVRKSDGVWLSTPGSKPAGGRPPAGWRPKDGEAAPAPESDAPGEPAKAAEAP